MGFTAKYDIGDKVWLRNYKAEPPQNAVVTEYHNYGNGIRYHIKGLMSTHAESYLCTHEQWHADHKPKLTPRELVAGDELVGDWAGKPRFRVIGDPSTGALLLIFVKGSALASWDDMIENTESYAIARTGQPLSDYLAGKPEPPELPLLGGREAIKIERQGTSWGTIRYRTSGQLPEGMGDEADVYLLTASEVEQLMRR